jgi:hypothetical protein
MPCINRYVPRPESSNKDALRARGIQELEVDERDVIDSLTDRELQEREPILPLLGL